MHVLGRYRLGRDKPDPKTWKANFRCALNSLTDVCELQDRSRKRGHLASRVYRMLPPTTPQTTPPRTRMHNTGRTDRFMQQIYHYGFMVNLSVSMDEGICYIMSMLIQMVYGDRTQPTFFLGVNRCLNCHIHKQVDQVETSYFTHL